MNDPLILAQDVRFLPASWSSEGFSGLSIDGINVICLGQAYKVGWAIIWNGVLTVMYELRTKLPGPDQMTGFLEYRIGWQLERILRVFHIIQRSEITFVQLLLCWLQEGEAQRILKTKAEKCGRLFVQVSRKAK